MTDAPVLPSTNLTRDQLIAGLRALKPAFVREGVTHMALFGSRARRDHRPDSDIDLMIEVDSGRKFSLVELARVGHVVEDRIGLPANIFMRRSLKPALLAAATRDETVVF